MFTLQDAEITAPEVEWHARAEDALGPDFGLRVARMVIGETVVLPTYTVLRRPPGLAS